MRRGGLRPAQNELGRVTEVDEQRFANIHFMPESGLQTAVRFGPLGDIAKRKFQRAQSLFFCNVAGVQAFLFYGAIETISQIRGGMPSLCSISQDGRAKENIAGNGSGVDEAYGRSRGTNSQKPS
jgi:hypothetical protein